MIHSLFYVALGSGLGGASRFLISKYLEESSLLGFPWNTFFVNVLGCLAAGFLFHSVTSQETLKHAILIGFFGGFTTLSTFCLDILKMIEAQMIIEGILYAFLTLSVSFLCACLGYFIGKQWA